MLTSEDKMIKVSFTKVKNPGDRNEYDEKIQN